MHNSNYKNIVVSVNIPTSFPSKSAHPHKTGCADFGGEM